MADASLEPSALRLALRRRPVLRISCVRSLCQCICEGVSRVPIGESLSAILEGCCAHNASQHCSSLVRGCSGALPELCAALTRTPLPRLSQLALLHALLLGSDAFCSGEATRLLLALLQAPLDLRFANEAEAELIAEVRQSLVASGGGPEWLVDSAARASLVSQVEQAVQAVQAVPAGQSGADATQAAPAPAAAPPGDGAPCAQLEAGERVGVAARRACFFG